MERKLKYKDIFSPIKGIFTSMTETDFLQFTDMTPEQVEIQMFHTCISRTIAPIVYYYLDDGKFTDESLESLSDLIYANFKRKWLRLAEVFDIEYNPIYNYYDKHTGDDKLSESTDIKKEREYTNYKEETEYERDDDYTPTGSRKTTRGYLNYKESTSDSQLDTDNKLVVDSSVYGFNSSEGVPSDSTETSTSYKNDSDKSITGSYSDEESFDQYKEARSRSGSESKSYTGKYADNITGSNLLNFENQNYNSVHMGNIGNLTTQQLLNEELEWRRNRLIKEIINDVKSFITLDIYD